MCRDNLFHDFLQLDDDPDVSSSRLSPGMLPPFSIAFVKGWRRSLACLICCEGVKSLGIELDELTSDFKAAACVEHIGFHG